MRVIMPLLVVALAAPACGGDSSPSPSPSPENGSVPSSPGRRLAWTQRAPSLDAARSYTFNLYVDGVKNPLPGTTCSVSNLDFECVATLPTISAGRHVLELSATDAAGAEGQRSAPLTINQSSQATPNDTARAPVTKYPAGRAYASCADPSSCFSTSVVADDVGLLERMVAFPDGRVLALYPGGIVRILPDGVPDRPDVGRSRRATDVADLAVDPDFPSNRFVYLASVDAVDGRPTFDIVRMREVGNQLGESATLAADLPMDGGRPAISVGPDRLIYVAVPSYDRLGGIGSAYAGLVLRLTRDGQAAGQERTRSPIFSTGSARPVVLEWPDGQHLLLGTPSELRVLNVRSQQASWPAAMTSLPLRPANGPRVIKSVTRSQPSGGAGRLFVLGSDPQLLYVARLTLGEPLALESIAPLSLGDLTPVALTGTSDGALIVAAAERDGAAVRLLRLRPQ